MTRLAHYLTLGITQAILDKTQPAAQTLADLMKPMDAEETSDEDS